MGTEHELRHNLEQAQAGLVAEFQAHVQTQHRVDDLEKELFSIAQENALLKELLTEAIAFEQVLFDYIASGIPVPAKTTTRARIIASLEDWRQKANQAIQEREEDSETRSREL